MALFLLTAYGRFKKERDKLKEELINKKKPELDDLRSFYRRIKGNI